VSPQIVQLRGLARDPVERLCRRIDEGFVHGQLPRAKVARDHAQGHAGRDGIVGGEHFSGISPRRRVEVDADEHAPQPGFQREADVVPTERVNTHRRNISVALHRQHNNLAGL
jgi:hypothetical protein